jgi:hypothetical protein
MTRVAAALAVLCAFALPAAARADTLIEGIALGSPLAVLLKSEGLPAATAAGSTGSAIVWRTPARQTTVYVDDDGVVDAVVDVPPGGTRVRVDFDGKPVVFVTGRFTLDQADAQLAANAQYSSATMRTYEPEPGRELVLLFDEKTAALATVIYGDRGTVARMGYVKADDIATSVPFHSAILNKSAIKDAGPGPAALIAYHINRHGVVTAVDVLAPSGVKEFDALLAAGLLDDRFTPAHLGGRGVDSTFYRLVHAQ